MRGSVAPMTTDAHATFRELHDEDLFVMPNAFDAGSAKLLEQLGFAAIATTSSGHAATLGRLDGAVSRDELLGHVEQLAEAVSIPVNADAEYCFADTVEGIAETIRLLANAGAAGCSIEDFNPEHQSIDPIEQSVERVAAAVEAAEHHGILLTARADGLLHGDDSTASVIERLEAFAAAGAPCVYAPGLRDPEEISAAAALAPLNVLALPGVPSVPELAELGVRRVSAGGALAGVAYGAFRTAAKALLTSGRYGYFDDMLPPEARDAAFG